MPFSIQCTNKGCCKINEPYIDPKTDKVYCSKCNNEMTNVTHFVKVQMKFMKQYKQKVELSFAVKCQKCGKEDRPKLVGPNEDVVCPSCNKSHDQLTEPFKFMLRKELKTAGKDII